jgi:hypothetical protein
VTSNPGNNPFAESARTRFLSARAIALLAIVVIIAAIVVYA